EEKESFKPRWSEIKLRAEKGRQAGLEKEPGFGISVKINKAYLLAGLYPDLLQERFKPTAEEKTKYLTEHPEADLEKLRQKAQGMLDRVKGGESFEKIADEVKQDGTKGRFEDLPWFGPGMMDPGFEKAAFALEKGQTSTELVKSRFGFHIIRVDDKRKATAPPPPGPTLDPAAPKPEPRDEVRARHILVDTREAESFEKRLSDEKVKRALEDAEIKYIVKVPDDFKVNVAGFDPNRVPGPGGGLNGPMQGPDAKQN
ncbi:MAG TPA: peptidylprolyl isomerase, partial [Blastocatellia bacterium]|nr:peptidylprolyl isomerase [Blastocatellia bacterium]